MFFLLGARTATRRVTTPTLGKGGTPDPQSGVGSAGRRVRWGTPTKRAASPHSHLGVRGEGDRYLGPRLARRGFAGEYGGATHTNPARISRATCMQSTQGSRGTESKRAGLKAECVASCSTIKEHHERSPPPSSPSTITIASFASALFFVRELLLGRQQVQRGKGTERSVKRVRNRGSIQGGTLPGSLPPPH